jgi:glycosyltransferase involved in cell wall biosynthesis
MDLSLVVPCYNEAPHLRASVAAVREVLEATRYKYEIVFVDDGSRDGTRELLQDLCATTPHCRCIFHDSNRGRGGAFKTGFAATQGRITGFLDIDLEVPAHYVPALMSLIEHHGVDVATGYRHYLLRQTLALHRVALSWIYRRMLNLSVGWDIKDSETGCKFFRRETATDVVMQSVADGWFWDTEVMVRGVLAGLRVQEMPVLFLRRWDKKSTVRLGRDIIDYLAELHRFRTAVGLSLRAKSPIYWTSRIYDLVMRLLYGRALEQTYADVARRIPDGASVVDLCCGTAKLYRHHLRGRGCQYLGLDFNGRFVLEGHKAGVPMRLFNLLTDPVPCADYVVMLSSLYHFRRQAGDVLARAKAAAREGVIISEPIRNLSTRPSWLGRIAGRLSNPGIGEYRERLDLAELRALSDAYGAAEFVHRPGDRNALLVFPSPGLRSRAVV